MSSYAVFWRTDGIPFNGRMEFDPHGFWLYGGERGHELRVEVPYDEIVGLERDSHSQIGSYQAIRIHTRAANDVLIGSIGGPGILGEIEDRLHHATDG